MKIIFPRFETIKFHDIFDGGNKYIEHLSEKLVQKGVEVEIVCPRPEGLKKKFEIVNGVKYVFLKPIWKEQRLIRLNMFYKLIFSYHLSKYLEKNKFDILHNTEMFGYFYTFKKRKQPIITQGWGLEPFYGPESLAQRGLKKIYVKMFLQKTWLRCLKKSEKVASEEEFQNELIQKLGIERKQIFALPPALDLDKIKLYEKTKKDQRQKLGIGKEDLFVLNVNQLAPDKRVQDIIKATSILKENNKIKLVIVGKGPSEEELKKMIKNQGIVNEVQMLKDLDEKELYNLYFSADIFVSASNQHDWIMSIQEAMACGLPIVSSGQPFLVKENINGFVVGIGKPEKIAKAIGNIWNGKKMKKMGIESKKLSQKYDWKNIADKSIKEYKKLLK